MNLNKVNRLEVIDHATGEGRAYVFWEKEPVKIELMLQDDDRTLKIFITKPQLLAAREE